MKLALIVVFAVVGVVLAEDCEDPKTKHKWAVGKTYTPIGECIEYTCLEGGGISGKTCPEEAAIGCEKLPADLTKPYPECCPKFKCP